MKHGSITTLQSQIGSQLSEQQRVKNIQSDQKRKYQLVRFWPPYFGMRKVFYSSISLRKGEPSIANIIYGVIGAFEGRNCGKTTSNEEEKNALSPKQCTVSQVGYNNGKIARIAL